jgi:hypothetical protein
MLGDAGESPPTSRAEFCTGLVLWPEEAADAGPITANQALRWLREGLTTAQTMAELYGEGARYCSPAPLSPLTRIVFLSALTPSA